MDRGTIGSSKGEEVATSNPTTSSSFRFERPIRWLPHNPHSPDVQGFEKVRETRRMDSLSGEKFQTSAGDGMRSSKPIRDHTYYNHGKINAIVVVRFPTSNLVIVLRCSSAHLWMFG